MDDGKPSASVGEVAEHPSRDVEPKRRGRRRKQAARPQGHLSRTLPDDLRPVIALLALTVVGSVLAVGTVHTVVLLCIAPFAVASGVWALVLNGRGFAGVPGPARVALALSTYSVAQALPIPLSVLRTVSPASASLWTGALASLGESARWFSLSLDPAASLVEALKWSCYAAVFCAGAIIAAAKSRRAVPAIVFGAALSAALVTVAHRLLGAGSLYGIYTPYSNPTFALAPLLNPNNFAGYLNLGAFAGLGLLMGRESSVPRWAIGLAVSVVVGLSAVCGSRAGLASLLLGMLVLVPTVRWFKADLPMALRWSPVAALTGGVALFFLAVRAELWESMLKEGAQKLSLISWTRPVVVDFPFFGIGRGAFETVFPAYRADVGHHIYQYAENFVMQWCVEWGMPAALGALIAFGFALRPALLRARSDVLALCCVVGVGVLLAQNLLDLALEVPSVSLAVFALLGSLWARRRPLVEASETARPVGLLAGLLVPFALLWCVAASVGLHTALDDRRDIAAMVRVREKHDPEAAKVIELDLHDAIRRHPADPYFPLVAAMLANEGDGKGKELTFVSRAIERDPMAGRPYLVLAEALARHHAKDQALHAVRLAVEREYELIGPGAEIALRLTRDVDDLLRAVPSGASGAGMLTYLGQHRAMRAFRAQLLEAAMSRDPAAIEPRVARAEDIVTAIETKSDACEGALRGACANELDALMSQIASIAPKSDRPTVYRARIEIARGNPRAAYDSFAQKCHTFTAQADCARVQFLAAAKLDDNHAIDESAAELLADACTTAEQCSSTASWLGSQLEGKGRPAAALHMYDRAAQEADTPEGWRSLAVAAARLGFTAAAQKAQRRAGSTTDTDTDFAHTSPVPGSASPGGDSSH